MKLIPENLVGDKFGRLTITAISHRDKYSHVHVKCKCDCGNEKIVRYNSLRDCFTRSCGCLQAEKRSRFVMERHNRRVKYV